MSRPFALSAALISGCSPAWVVVSDLHGDRVFVTNAATGAIAGEVDIDGAWSSECHASDEQHRFCLVYQSHVRTLGDGSTEVDLTFTPVGNDNSTDGDDYIDLGGRIVGAHFMRGVSFEPPETRWQVDHLDFSAVDPEQRICKRDAADPCRPASGLTVDEARACQLYWPHEFEVIEEDDDSVLVAVADTRNHRVLWVDVPLQANPTAGAPSSGTCGTVTEVVGGTSDPGVPGGSADWDIYTSVNGIAVQVDGDGVRHLFLSIKDTSGDPDQSPGDGRGKVLSWSDAGGWHQEWEFPPQAVAPAEPAFVNSPHGISFDDDHVYFAQSLGASATFNEGSGGTYTVLDRDGAYVFDVVLPHDTILYARDIAPLGDGRFALVDSGTKGDEKEAADTHLWLVRLPDAPKSPLSGAWSADHVDQVFETATVLASPKYPDAWVLYSAEPVQ